MTEKRTMITDMEYTRDVLVKHEAETDRILVGHPHAADIARSLAGWLAASALLETKKGPGATINMLHCLVTSIYTMGYERGRRETSLPVFIVRDPEDMREGL